MTELKISYLTEHTMAQSPDREGKKWGWGRGVCRRRGNIACKGSTTLHSWASLTPTPSLCYWVKLHARLSLSFVETAHQLRSCTFFLPNCNLANSSWLLACKTPLRRGESKIRGGNKGKAKEKKEWYVAALRIEKREEWDVLSSEFGTPKLKYPFDWGNEEMEECWSYSFW